MADYPSMYLKLFNAVTDAIEILQQAQRETEEMYIAADDLRVTVLPKTVADSCDMENPKK